MSDIQAIDATERFAVYQSAFGSFSLPKWIYLNGNHVNHYTKLLNQVTVEHSEEAKEHGFVMRRIYFYIGLKFVKKYGRWEIEGHNLDDLLAAENDLEKENAALVMSMGSWFTKYFTDFFQ